LPYLLNYGEFAIIKNLFRQAEKDNKMTEPAIICSRLKTEIKLNESLDAPLIEATRKKFEST